MFLCCESSCVIFPHITEFTSTHRSVAEPELRGAVTFRVGPEPIFMLAPDASFWQAKQESLVTCDKIWLEIIYNGKCDPKKTCINKSLFKNSKWKMLVYGARAAFFCLEPEPPFFLPGAGADPIWSEPESAPGHRTSRAGATQKSGGSATLHTCIVDFVPLMCWGGGGGGWPA